MMCISSFQFYQSPIHLYLEYLYFEGLSEKPTVHTAGLKIIMGSCVS